MKQYRKFLKRMIHRYVSGRSTEAEQDFLQSLDRYRDRHLLSPFHDLSADEKEQLKTQGWQAVQQRKDEFVRIPRFVRRGRRYAAVMLVGVGVAALLYVFPRFDNKPAPANAVTVPTVSSVIEPEHGQATLRLPDGRVVALSDQQQGIKLGDAIAYLDGSRLDGIVVDEGTAPLELVMETPRGGNYQVTLSDGTRVWLNAASKLSYPSRFEGRERVVQLEGEAYFEVVKGQRPFIVITSAQTIEVLGTSFNISAYGDDTHTTTTLLSGSVHLRDRKSAQTQELSPGEQAVLSDRAFSVQKVDVLGSIAWKDNYFYFSDTPLVEILRQLRRWYDFDLKDDAVPELHFTGGVPRDVPLSHVLAMLESTTEALHFEIQDRTLALKAGRRDVP